MNYTKSNIDSTVNDNKIEIVENKALLFIKKFWQFSLFYGDYIGSLHSRKTAEH